jgi:hypothetical protein
MHVTATAQDLMTPYRDLLVAEAGLGWDLVLAEAAERRYDVVPHREYGCITGIVRVSTGEMEPLTPRWLLSSDTSMPDLLETLAESDPAVRLVLYGDEVVGLVSAADLNKLPMRAYLYHVVGLLELSIATFVRQKHRGDLMELVELLCGKKRRSVLGHLEGMTEGNADVDPVQLFDLSDLITCLEKSEKCRGPLGYVSRNQAHDVIGGLNELRNGTMHLVRPVIASVSEDSGKLRDRVARAWELIEKLEELRQDPTA